MAAEKGRVVLITGASAGIGRATAELLARRGWQVVGASRRGSAGTGWRGIVMDVDDEASVAEGVAGVLGDHGRLDALVANAGFGLAGAVEHTPIEQARAQLETNFFGAARLVGQALAPMRLQGGGRVVLVSSIGGVIGIPFQAYYSASKFALEGYGEALAYEVAPFNISVCLVEPGNVRTDFTRARRDVTGPSERDPYRAAVAKAIGRMASDEEKGAPASLVAGAIARVLESRRPPRRVSVGKIDERAGTFAKRLLPYALFERAARSSLGV